MTVMVLDGVTYRKTLYGYLVRHLGERSADVEYNVYYRNEYERRWNTLNFKEHIAYLNAPEQFALIPCNNLELALQIAARFVRTLCADIDAVLWNRQRGMLYFDLMRVTSNGQFSLRTAVRNKIQGLRVSAAADAWKGRVALFADDLDVQFHVKREPSNSTESMKPILYITFTGVLIMHPEFAKVEDKELFKRRYPNGEPAPGARAFLEWARQYYDIRWLDHKAGAGRVYTYCGEIFAKLFDMPQGFFENIYNPKGIFCGNLTSGIEFSANRPWAWLHPPLSEIEHKKIVEENALGNLVETDSSADPTALITVWKQRLEPWILERAAKKAEEPVPEVTPTPQADGAESNVASGV